MAQNAQNVRIGDATLTFDGVLLGHTLGGVKFTYTPEEEDLRVDKYAGSIDSALTSENLVITVTMAEPVVDMLRYAFVGGTYATGSGKKQIQLGTTTGVLATSRAKGLLLHPRTLSASDTSEDVYIFKAAVVDEVELNYEVDGQRVYEVKFRAYVDENSTQGTLGRIGPALS